MSHLRILTLSSAVAAIALLAACSPSTPEVEPGMEVGPPEPYDILSVDSAGRTAIFASRGK